jgi:uncharacterized protein YjbI with pentapeptide repeats
VLIGASAYSHLEDLPAVRNNLSGFRDVLVDPALGGLPADNCTVVAEPAGPVDLYRMLRQQAAAAEDTLLVYFAGHGRTGSRNELFLCLPDTDPDELPYSAWPYDELRRVVADSRAAKKVVILDCCFSGRALADQAGDEETILGQVGIQGTYLLTATAANAVALAAPGERYTAFTGALLDLLNKGIPDGPELLTFEQIYPRLQYTLTSCQLPRPRQQGSDTIAHLALTRNLAYAERGRTRVFNERFTAIATQLGDAQPAVRLAGVYAMAALADDWDDWGEEQQTCVDALCAYLRLPYDPDPGDDAARAEKTAYQANREVRHSVIRIITAHLQEDAAVSWQDLNFDLTGVVFDGGDFGGARFSGGTVSFRGTEFSGGTVSFRGTEFSDSQVNFYHARFSGGTVSFRGTEFSDSEVDFRSAEFSGGEVDFSRAEFSGGEVSFGVARFCGGEVNFTDARFRGGDVGFDYAWFSDGRVDFSRAEFSGGTVDYVGARFSGGQVNFYSARFSGSWVNITDARFSCSWVSFRSAGFSGGTVDFTGAEFSGGRVNFSRAEFSGGTVDFTGAEFSGGTVDFRDTEFSGGTVDFRAGTSGVWSHPPLFNWDNKPPVGVVLPVQPPEERNGVASMHPAGAHDSGTDDIDTSRGDTIGSGTAEGKPTAFELSRRLTEKLKLLGIDTGGPEPRQGTE